MTTYEVTISDGYTKNTITFSNNKDALYHYKHAIKCGLEATITEVY